MKLIQKKERCCDNQSVVMISDVSSLKGLLKTSARAKVQVVSWRKWLNNRDERTKSEIHS